MEQETSTWKTTHNHSTGDFECDFGCDVKVSVSMKLQTAYVTKRNETIDSFSISAMNIESFHNILLGIAKSL